MLIANLFVKIFFPVKRLFDKHCSVYQRKINRNAAFEYNIVVRFTEKVLKLSAKRLSKDNQCFI